MGLNFLKALLLLAALTFGGVAVAQTVEEFDYLTRQLAECGDKSSDKNIELKKIYNSSDNRGSLSVSACNYLAGTNTFRFTVIDYNGKRYLLRNADMNNLIALMTEIRKKTPSLLDDSGISLIIENALSGIDISVYKYDRSLFFSKYISAFFSKKWEPHNFSSMKTVELVNAISDRHPGALPMDGLYKIISSQYHSFGSLGENGGTENLSVKPIDAPYIPKSAQPALRLYRVDLKYAHIDSDEEVYNLLIEYNGNYILCRKDRYLTWVAALYLINSRLREPMTGSELAALIGEMVGKPSSAMYRRCNGIQCAGDLYTRVFRPEALGKWIDID